MYKHRIPQIRSDYRTNMGTILNLKNDKVIKSILRHNIKTKSLPELKMSNEEQCYSQMHQRIIMCQFLQFLSLKKTNTQLFNQYFLFQPGSQGIMKQLIDNERLFVGRFIDMKDVANDLRGFHVTRHSDGAKFRCLPMIQELNPTRTLQKHYAFCTGTGYGQFETRLFCDCALNKVLLNPIFKQAQKQELRSILFQKDERRTVQSDTQVKRDRIFAQLYSWRQKFMKNEVGKEQVLNFFNSSYPPFKLSEDANSRWFEWWINFNLYHSINFQTLEMVQGNVKELRKRLCQEEAIIGEKYAPIDSYKQYRHETLIFIKEFQSDLIPLEDICINMQIRPQSASKLSSKDFAKLFYSKLTSFNESFGYHYMCLSPQNIKYDSRKKQIKLDILSLILKTFGIMRTPQSVRTLSEIARPNAMIQFWKSEAHLNPFTQRLFKCQQEILWEFIMLVDYFEKMGKNYFFYQAKNIKQILVLQKDLNNIIKDSKERDYFGETVCQMIRYLRQLYVLTSSDGCQTFELSFCQLSDLKGFFSEEANLPTKS